MKKVIIILTLIMFINNAHSNTIENIEVEEVLKTDCGSVYNATLAYMNLRNYSPKVAVATAEAAREACWDENEAEAGTNPDCKVDNPTLKN